MVNSLACDGCAAAKQTAVVATPKDNPAERIHSKRPNNLRVVFMQSLPLTKSQAAFALRVLLRLVGVAGALLLEA
jgi:hypothetical protein